MISDKLSLPYPNDAGIIHKFPIQQKKAYNLSTVCYFQWWSQAESNCRHKDFQSFALPTELQDHWLRGKDLNQRPPGYGPDELPGCSTSRCDLREYGGGAGIRTLAPVSRPTGFQDRTLQPLGYSSIVDPEGLEPSTNRL